MTGKTRDKSLRAYFRSNLGQYPHHAPLDMLVAERVSGCVYEGPPPRRAGPSLQRVARLRRDQIGHDIPGVRDEPIEVRAAGRGHAGFAEYTAVRVRSGGIVAPPGPGETVRSSSVRSALRNATRSAFSALVSFSLQHEVEELDRVLQRQAAAVVQVRRAVLDAAQREAS